MDQESLTQDAMAWMTKTNELKVGCFTYLRLLNAGLTPESTMELGAGNSLEPSCQPPVIFSLC
jgi:hypothetical protein